MILDEFFKPNSTAVLAENNLHGGRPDDEVKFFIDSEPAYYAVMDRFGDHIEFRGEDMVAPLRLWGSIQQTAGDAGGAADIAGLEDEPMWVGDALDEPGVAEGYDEWNARELEKLRTRHPEGTGSMPSKTLAKLHRIPGFSKVSPAEQQRVAKAVDGYLARDMSFDQALVLAQKQGVTEAEGVAEGSLTEEAGTMVIRKLIAEFNEQISGSPYYPLDYKDVGMGARTRGDGARYKDPGYIFNNRDLKPEDRATWQKEKPVEKFWEFLSDKGARKIGDVSGEFGSDPHSPAVLLGKLIFVFNGRTIAWGSASRLKNSSVWRQKQQGVAESGYDSGDYSNDRQSDDYGRDLVPTGSGGSRFVNHGARDHTRGRPAKTHGFSKNLPADPFGRTAGKIPHSARPKQELDPFRELDELSPATLASYKTKAGAAATAADSTGDRKTGDRRFSGIVKATKKQFDQDAKPSAQAVHESRLRVMASIIKTQ